jgi:hypothetical protein
VSRHIRTLTVCLLICVSVAQANAQTVAQMSAQKAAAASLQINHGAASAQELRTALKDSADGAAHDLLITKTGNSIDQIQLNLGKVVADYLSFIARTRALKSAEKAAETARTDKQISASSSSGSGSTSVVDKPGIAELLGFAIEHGAVTQSVQDNTVTFSTSPYAFAAWVGGGDTAENYQKYGNTYGRVGISANFNLTDTSNPTLSATRKQLNEWTGRIRLLGDHSGRSADALKVFQHNLGPTLQRLANDQAGILFNALKNDKSYGKVQLDIGTHIVQYLQDNPNADQAAQQQAISQIIVDGVIAGFQNLNPPIEVLKKLAQLADDYDKAAELTVAESKEMNDAIGELSKKAALTFVYAQEQPAVGNNYSALKLVFAKGPQDSMQITVNVSGSLYHHPIATKNQETFRDFTASLDLTQKLGRSPFLFDVVNKDPITMSFAGRYERMPENQGIPGKKADIAVAGAKFEIPVAAGVSFPVSVTYANATELIKESHVSGNFGISFDLDKLKALVSK